MTDCLVCGRPATDLHHWPETIGMGRNRKRHPELPTVPVCRSCHMRAGDADVIEALIAKAPGYWRARGEWERAEPYYERFVARREYMTAGGLR